MGNDYLGLFGQIGAGAYISDLKIVDVNIRGRSCLGGLCGSNAINDPAYGGIYVINCSATGSVTGHAYLGGLCGSNGVHAYIIGGDFTDCWSSVSVTGSGRLGGLCGYNSSAHITIDVLISNGTRKLSLLRKQESRKHR